MTPHDLLVAVAASLATAAATGPCFYRWGKHKAAQERMKAVNAARLEFIHAEREKATAAEMESKAKRHRLKLLHGEGLMTPELRPTATSDFPEAVKTFETSVPPHQHDFTHGPICVAPGCWANRNGRGA